MVGNTFQRASSAIASLITISTNITVRIALSIYRISTIKLIAAAFKISSSCQTMTPLLSQSTVITTPPTSISGVGFSHRVVSRYISHTYVGRIQYIAAHTSNDYGHADYIFTRKRNDACFLYISSAYHYSHITFICHTLTIVLVLLLLLHDSIRRIVFIRPASQRRLVGGIVSFSAKPLAVSRPVAR